MNKKSKNLEYSRILKPYRKFKSESGGVSRKGKKFRKYTIIIELFNLVWLVLLFKFGFGWFGFWKNILYIFCSIAFAFICLSIYNIVAVNKEMQWRKQEIRKAADKMAGINLQLRQVFPHRLSQNGNLELSRWWGKDEKIVRTYLYRYCRGIRVNQSLLDAVNWCYRLGWYRSKEELEDRENRIVELEEQIQNLEEQLQDAREREVQAVQKVEENIMSLEDDLESNIRKLLLEGVKQTDVAEILGTSQSKVSRVKKKMR